MNYQDYTPNSKKVIDEQLTDLGSLLRELRENQGWSLLQMSKRLGMKPEKISRIERSVDEIPSDAKLRNWLKKLGLGDRQTTKVIKLANNFRIKHSLQLRSGEKCNADMIRVLEAYKDKKLTEYDRVLLSLIART